MGWVRGGVGKGSASLEKCRHWYGRHLSAGTFPTLFTRRGLPLPFGRHFCSTFHVGFMKLRTSAGSCLTASRKLLIKKATASLHNWKSCCTKALASCVAFPVAPTGLHMLSNPYPLFPMPSKAALPCLYQKWPLSKS